MEKVQPNIATRSFQFSLQTTILLVAVVAIAIAWWTDHQRLSEQLRKAKMRVQFLETSRIYDAPVGKAR